MIEITDTIKNPETSDPEELVIETSLRPRKLSEFIGQNALKVNLQIAIDASKSRGESLDHTLFYGPPGLGKTTLAGIIASEMGSGFKTSSGPAITRAGDLASILTNLAEGDVLFIDEIHRLNKNVEEILYSAMEDGFIDIILGKGPGARSIRMDLPKFTLVGATTRIGMLSGPLRDRFGSVFHLDYYDQDDLSSIIKRSATLLNSPIDSGAIEQLALRSRFTPRIANRLFRRVRDFAQVNEKPVIDNESTKKALELLGIDGLGLDKNDRMILEILITKFAGGPVGLSTLAAATGEEKDTIEEVYEPFLIRHGLLSRTLKGRIVTDKAYTHLNIQRQEVTP